MMLLVLCSGLYLLSCSKDDTQADITNASAKKNKTIIEGAPCFNCQTGGNFEPLNLTDAQLIDLGTQVGCELAKRNGYFYGVKVMQTDAAGNPVRDAQGNLLYTTVSSSAYGVYVKTISNPDFPEYYREGVREGWLNCYSRGEASTNCTNDVIVSSIGTDGSLLFEKKTMCQWLGITQ